MFIMILRDYEVTGIRQIGQLKGKIIAADKVAKTKANFLYATLVYGLLINALNDTAARGTEFMKYFTLVFYVFVGITTALIIISGMVYLINNFSVFKEDKKQEDDKQVEEVKEAVEDKVEEVHEAVEEAVEDKVDDVHEAIAQAVEEAKATKVCPLCGVEVDADAKVCPVCGYEFE